MNDKQVKSLIKKGEHGRHAVDNGLYLRIANNNIGDLSPKLVPIHG